MSTEEAVAYDFACELSLNRGVCDETYRMAVETFGERGVVDLVCIIGYFTLISMVLNVAHTPPEPSSAVAPLLSMPR
jgi:4-carboxymuconolactone decarboxylase